jgi:hypothetical protein
MKNHRSKYWFENDNWGDEETMKKIKSKINSYINNENLFNKELEADDYITLSLHSSGGKSILLQSIQSFVNDKVGWKSEKYIKELLCGSAEYREGDINMFFEYKLKERKGDSLCKVGVQNYGL